MLPIADLDPCSNPRSTVRARRTYSLEKKLDGRKLPWRGSIFLNWPYSDPMPWAEKLIAELESGQVVEAIVLCKLDPSVGWWQTLMTFGSPDLWVFDRRLQFGEPEALVAERLRKYAEAGKPGGEKSSTNFPSAILHYRSNGVIQRPSGLASAIAPVLQLDTVATRWRRA
jgi:hypothetical protein